MFRGTREHSNADGLSRLPIQHNAEYVSEETPEVVLLMQGLQDSTVNFAQIKAWTSKDPVLAQVLAFVRTGWPEKEPKTQDGLAPFGYDVLSSRSLTGAFFDVIVWLFHPGEGSMY